jgi:putative membrane protein
MGTFRKRTVQLISMLIVQTIVMYLVGKLLTGFSINGWKALLAMTIGFALAQGLFWWVFIRFFSWLPVWLYPIMTFVVNGALIYWVGNKIPGVTVESIGTAIWISIWATVFNAILGAIFSLDEDEQFDRTVTFPMVKRRANPEKTDVPGFVFLEIDGLSEHHLRHALEHGHMPTVKRWLDAGTHRIDSWETDYSSQTGAMQTGILIGSNHNVPAYRWWDRAAGQMVIVGSPKHSKDIEARLSTGFGLLSHGGSSRGNMFSGDATESLFTFSTLLDRTRGTGPGFYMFLVSPYVLARLVTRFVNECIKEWWEQFAQRRRKDKYICSARDIKYAFIRGFMGPILGDLTTYTIITDIMRGLPAMYALYGGYDDLAHFAGKDTPEAEEALAELDKYFTRVERAVAQAPRPYHIVVLADHGQCSGPFFKTAYGHELKDIVNGLVGGDAKIEAELETAEAWDNLNAVLTETVASKTRIAGMMKPFLRNKEAEGSVQVAPGGGLRDEQGAPKDAKVVIYGSGGAGLVYFTDSKERLTYEQILASYPDLILGLINHPGVGFVLVHSEQQGPLVLTKGGVYYLKDDVVEGNNPLADYGPNAALHLRRETSFVDCPDLLVNTRLDPQTGEMPGFENQASHHGALGGLQNQPFVLHPVMLPGPAAPVVGADAVCRLMRGWREQVQGIPAPAGNGHGSGDGSIKVTA